MLQAGLRIWVNQPPQINNTIELGNQFIDIKQLTWVGWLICTKRRVVIKQIHQIQISVIWMLLNTGFYKLVMQI